MRLSRPSRCRNPGPAVPFLTGLVALVAAVPAGAEPQAVKGEVTRVILYKGQALVTREVPLGDLQGSLEILVTGLPEKVVGESLFAESGPGVEVRAVRFRARAVGEEPREEVRELEEGIEALKDKLDANRRSQEVLAKRLAYLDKLEAFSASSAAADLSRGVLDAAALEKLSLFSFAQRQAAAAEGVKLAREAKELGEELALLERKRAELASSSSRTVREAALFIERAAGGDGRVRLNYLVTGCGWSPSYVLRAPAGGEEVRLEYHALVHQMTGEDWNGVELTLSTASPALSAAGPGLAPFHLTLMDPQAQGQAGPADLASRLKSFKQRQAIAIASNLAAVSLEQTIGTSWDANEAACGLQLVELVGGREVLGTVTEDDRGLEDGPSLSYRLSTPLSLASRSDQQMARILEATLKSRLYHVATPILSSYVYREAEVTNSSSEDLLAGPVTAYLDGRFVGRAEIPTVTRGQTFVVGFGADPQLRCRRDLLAKTEGVQGGNREISLRYALAIESYMGRPAAVRILDRLPYTGREGDVRVTLKEQTDPLSDDKTYQRHERPKGILRWDIEVPAGAAGEEARTIEYTYTVEHDRKYALAVPGSTPQLQQEFLELHRARAVTK